MSNVLDAAADLGEVGLDGAIEFGREIPVLGTLLALGRLGAGVRDHLFARKLIRFYGALASTSEAERVAFVDAIRNDGQLARAGEAMLEVLDKASTTEKATLIGKLYAHCVRRGVAWSDCERMSEMVAMAYLGDLRYLQSRGDAEIGETGDEVEHLIALGFYRRELFRSGHTVTAAAQPTLTSFGRHLLQAFTY